MKTSILVLCLVTLAVLPARGEFVIKYFIDGHIVAPNGCGGVSTGSSQSCWVADMDGDQSPEMLVFGGSEDDMYPSRATIGITHVATGQTLWFDEAEVGRHPAQIRSGIYTSVLFEVPPLLYDVDGDDLPDALVPIWDEIEDRCMTAVIGWVGGAGVGDQGVPGSSVPLNSIVSPNPSPGPCSVAFRVPSEGEISATVLDVSGRIVRHLLDGPHPTGEYRLEWDGTDDNGRELPAGVYLTRIETGEGVTSERIVLAR